MLLLLAVQQERKPPSPDKAIAQHIATSAQKFYIRKQELATPAPVVSNTVRPTVGINNSAKIGLSKYLVYRTRSCKRQERLYAVVKNM